MSSYNNLDASQATMSRRRRTEEFNDRGITFGENNFLSHHGVLAGRQLKGVSVEHVLYIVGQNAHVHIRDACSIGRIQMFIPVDSALYLGGK